jgi:hypothetical protein
LKWAASSHPACGLYDIAREDSDDLTVKQIHRHTPKVPLTRFPKPTTIANRTGRSS